MKVFNIQFILNNRIRLFVEQSLMEIVKQDPSMLSEKVYWLYYYIKTDYDMILNSLLNYDLDADFLGFPNQHKTIRHQIEAFLDLYNLSCDPGYEAVLRFCSREKVPLGKYEKDRGNSAIFSNLQKMNIAKRNGFQYAWYLEEITKESNKYVHPNVFLESVKESDKEKVIRDILSISSFLMGEAYQIMLSLFAPEGKQPRLDCGNCMMQNHDCGVCFSTVYNRDRYFIAEAKELFEELTDSTNDFLVEY